VATHAKDALGGAPKVPGESDSDVDTDTEKMTGIAFTIMNDLIKEGSASLDGDDLSIAKTQIGEFVQELVRAGGAELHNIGALAGGIVSQEIIKVITEQYVPVDNTCIFDGVRSKSAVFRV
jgi:amyloid beta precursor protein binding protein 1